MRKLLHIIATPRSDESRTLKVSEAFLGIFKKRYPGCSIDGLNLFRERLPGLTLKQVEGKYALLGGGNLSADMAAAWKEIIMHIERFMAADAYLISTPMWNFGIPYELKHYIDIIVQPRYLFRYTGKGPEGLVTGRKMAVITTRGGDYSQGSPSQAYDLQEPYLRTVFGFVGLKDITFINAQPMDALGPQICQEKIREAQGAAAELAGKF